MKAIFIVFISLLLCGDVLYGNTLTNPELRRLMSSSELIFYGKIVRTNPEQFIMKINRVIKGNYSDSEIVLSKFHDWICAYRFGKYAIGQEELVFAIRGEKGVYNAIGDNAEGEMPVVGDKVYYAGNTGATHSYEIYNGVLLGFEYSMEQMIAAINFYLKNEQQILKGLNAGKKYNLSKYKNPVLDKLIEELQAPFSQ